MRLLSFYCDFISRLFQFILENIMQLFSFILSFICGLFSIDYAVIMILFSFYCGIIFTLFPCINKVFSSDLLKNTSTFINKYQQFRKDHSPQSYFLKQ